MKYIIIIILTVIATLLVVKVIDYADVNNETVIVADEVKNMSDEEQIEYIVDKFNQSYANGDFSGITDCMTKRASNQTNANFGLISKILSGVIGKLSNNYINADDDTIANLWVAGTGTYQMQFDIIEIEISDEETAYVSINIIQSDKNQNLSGELSGYLLMKKEDGCWLIDNIYEGSR